MIRAEELMIGNWITCHFLTTNFNAQILEIRKDVVVVQDGELTNGYGYDNISPIPLTPELLEKCGFKLSINGTCYGLITNGGKCRLSLFSDGSMKLGTQDLPHQILNLNTLQNVFYALTGNELQINL